MRYAFLLYENRSGSTLLAALLDQSHDVVVMPETDFPRHLLSEPMISGLGWSSAIVERILREDVKLTTLDLWSLDEKIIPGDEILGFEEVLKVVSDRYLLKQGWTDPPELFVFKTNVIFVRQKLLENLPKAEFLSIVRDGRAVFESQRRTPSLFADRPINNSVVWAAWTWRRKSNALVTPPGTVVVKYEDLVRDPGDVLAYLGRELRFSPCTHTEEFDDFYLRIPNQQKSLHSGVADGGLDVDRVERWRSALTPTQVSLFNWISRSELNRWGYERGSTPFRQLKISDVLAEVRMLLSRFVQRVGERRVR